MICTSSCTVFVALEKGFERRYIPECHWVENLSSSVTKTGRENAQGITLYIPPEHKKLAPENTDRDMLVKGKCNFIFDNTDERTVSECMREFRKQYKFFTVMSVENKLYSGGTSHIKVVAK